MNKYALVQNGVIIERRPSLPMSWGNQSGTQNWTLEEAIEHGWFPYEEEAPPNYGPDQTIEQVEVVEEARVRKTWNIRPLNQDEIAERRTTLVMFLNQHQSEVEAGGVTIPGVTVRLPSTERAKVAFIAGSSEVAKGRTMPVKAKGHNGQPVTLSAAQVDAAYTAALARYEACMAVYHKLYPRIISGEITSADQIVSDPDWPS